MKELVESTGRQSYGYSKTPKSESQHFQLKYDRITLHYLIDYSLQQCLKGLVIYYLYCGIIGICMLNLWAELFENAGLLTVTFTALPTH